ncbi:hypothetical protein JOE30_002095 [Rhodococcus sp. PvP016]|uniref:Uncharacterized protein n=1 Tax=Rhodococcoides corynebacterioides TaxID=53972 RepID=A0ABS2KPE0_9NOCA|nr:hypothetical protein [Rhodococcus corynebacterioides]MBP1116298.1 hypothetical protein [Rhodococcus sp. PvP016]
MIHTVGGGSGGDRAAQQRSVHMGQCQHADDEGQAEQRVTEHRHGHTQLTAEERKQQGTRGRRHHGRDHGHQPRGDRGAIAMLDAGHHDVGNDDARRQPEHSSDHPEGHEHRGGSAVPHDVATDQSCTGTHGEQSHRDGAVELHHHRVRCMAQCDASVPLPRRRVGHTENDQCGDGA